MIMIETIKANINGLLKARGTTMAALEEHIGVSKGYIKRLDGDIYLSKLIAAADFFNVKPEVLWDSAKTNEILAEAIDFEIESLKKARQQLLPFGEE